MSDTDSDRAVFVFDPDASYGLVDDIKRAEVMPTPGLRYVASVTGPWKIIKVISFEGSEQLVQRLNAPGDDTAVSFAPAKVRRSLYRDQTFFVRIDTDVADPGGGLLETIAAKIAAVLEISVEDVEADVIVGDFDILVCLSHESEDTLGSTVLAIRAIPGVRRTVTLRVLDYVSTSENADPDHKVNPA